MALPALGTVGWDDEMAAHLAVGHNADGTNKHMPVSALQVFVDYVNGSDTNNGLSPGAAYKTIAAAYSALTTRAEATYTAVSSRLGVGRIVLLPGDHDVGAGVAINSMRPVEIVGFRSGNNSYYAGSASTVMSTSAAATEFFKVSNASNIGHGATFSGINFRMNSAVNTALTKIIYTTSVDHLHVDHCSFLNGDGSTATDTVTAIYQDTIAVGSGTDDSAWFRIRDNICTNMQFYKNAGTNHNRSIMDGNVVFFGSTTVAMVHFAGDLKASTVSNNNFEGKACAVRVDTTGAADHNVFLNNSGESADNTNPFYDIVTGCNNCYFIGGYCDSKNNSNGIWIEFGADAWNNIVIGAYDYVGANGNKQQIVDNSTNGANTIWHPDWGIPIRTFTDASVSDASFDPARPHNGTFAVTNNGGTRKLWTRVGGSWYSVTVT